MLHLSSKTRVIYREHFVFGILHQLFVCLSQGERHVLGIGEVSGREILRKEVLHRLALGPASRSEIVKNLPSKDPDNVSSLKKRPCFFDCTLS